MVPSTVVIPRAGSFALAAFGRVRNVQEPAFAVVAGRKSFALKRILETVFATFSSWLNEMLGNTLVRRGVSRRKVCRPLWWEWW